MTKTVELGHHFNTFVDRQIEQGKYQSSDDVLRAGLRLLEAQEAKLEALRAALIEGEESGPAMPFDIEEFLEEMRSESNSQG